jgi:hypothetical protein
MLDEITETRDTMLDRVMRQEGANWEMGTVANQKLAREMQQ